MTDVVIDPYAEEPLQPDGATRAGGFSPVAILMVLIALMMIGVVAWGIYQNSQSQPDSGAAPNFALPLMTEEGVFSLAGHEGQVVVVNFWGSWCGPCRREAPMLQNAYLHYQDQGVVFVGIAIKDIERDALAYIDEFNITYPNVMDLGGEVEDAYRVEGVPETFVIDRNGEIVEFFYAQPSEIDFYAAIEEALES